MEPVAGLLIGLAGSLHCAGMCGPIAMALPRNPTDSKATYVTGRFLYQFGRIFTYMVIGALAGLGASAITFAGYESVVSITAGVLMMLAATMQLLWHKSLLPTGPIMRLTAPMRKSMQQLMKTKSTLALGGIGIVNGLLPCGLVLAAIFGSASTGSPVEGAVFMAGFGLGTLPVMSAIALGGGVLLKKLTPSFRLLMPSIALLLGMVFVVRGMHLGIPYVSPKPPISHTQAACCSDGESEH